MRHFRQGRVRAETAREAYALVLEIFEGRLIAVLRIAKIWPGKFEYHVEIRSPGEEGEQS